MCILFLLSAYFLLVANHITMITFAFEPSASIASEPATTIAFILELPSLVNRVIFCVTVTALWDIRICHCKLTTIPIFIRFNGILSKLNET
mmetsp:Transcript_42913/g.62867  ORF Transcript_42913/g.62867 Transcript_42913/m.62867 type:complete len:91 (-) Transcript_42913:954-1226(-)